MPDFMKNAPSESTPRRIMGAASLAHVFHDGATDLHYLLFALWQQQFGLSLAQVGLLKMLFSGSMSLLQIPSGEAGRVLGARKVLVGGTILLSLALFLYGFANNLTVLMCLIVLGGIGASVQHPLASSYISRYFAGDRARVALSTYNFFGDIGKVIIPSALSGLLLLIHWNLSVQVIGLSGCLVAAMLWVLLNRDRSGERNAAAISRHEAPTDRRADSAPIAQGGAVTEIRRKLAFSSLCVIGGLDNATRTGTLTFLPFLLAAKGASASAVGLSLTVIFVGGALGKLVCGVLATRLGILKTVIVSELATAGIILAFIHAPLMVSYLLLCPLGIALNGTSSVLYGTVAELARPRMQTRAFAIFYTISLGCGAVMPVVYGVLGDRLGVPDTLRLVALLLLCIVPLLVPLRVVATRAHQAR